MKLDEFCSTLETKLAGAVGEEFLALSSLALQQAFKVEEDEVAFLKLDGGTETLHFIWPKEMGKAGSIPLTSRDSLAARTVKEQTPQLNNRFSSAHHASFFELFKVGKEQRPRTIQKIMSVPLTDGDLRVGAAQVCRKAEEAGQAGEDFNKTELSALTEIAKVIARNFKEEQPQSQADPG